MHTKVVEYACFFNTKQLKYICYLVNFFNVRQKLVSTAQIVHLDQ